MNDIVIKGLKGESAQYVKNSNSCDNGEVGNQDGQDHEIETALSPLGAVVGSPAAVDGRTSGPCDLSEACISENYITLVRSSFGCVIKGGMCLPEYPAVMSAATTGAITKKTMYGHEGQAIQLHPSRVTTPYR